MIASRVAAPPRSRSRPTRRISRGRSVSDRVPHTVRPASDRSRPAQPDPEPAHWFAAGWDDDGTVHLLGNADSIDGSVILNASQEAEDALFRDGDIRATWLDVLVEECARSLGTLTTKSRRDLYRAISTPRAQGCTRVGPSLAPSWRRSCATARFGRCGRPASCRSMSAAPSTTFASTPGRYAEPCLPVPARSHRPFSRCILDHRKRGRCRRPRVP